MLPDAYAAVKIENFAIKPAVSGIPPKLNKNKEKAVATHGDFLA